MWGQRLNQLSDAQREDAWLRFDEGSATISELARRFAVSVATMSRIVRDRRQRRNVHTVPDEKVGSQQPQEQPCEAGPGSPPEKVLLAEGRKRKPIRSIA